MNKRQEEFLARLRETFRIEAGEHLEAITAGLVAIERAGDAERAPIVERIFREAHSLKGAARSVSLAGVEALCLEIESVFSAMKHNEITVSTTLLDDIHPALDIISVLCANPGAAPSPDTGEKEQRALAALRRIVRGSPDKKNVTTAAPAWVELPEPVEPRTGDTGSVPEEMTATSAAAPETVRVSTTKLGAILLEVEELVSAKIAGSGHASELRTLAADLGNWNHRRARQLMGQRHGRDGMTAAAEIIESEMLYTKALENSLRNLATSAHQDAHTLGTIVDSLLEDTKKVLLLPCSYLLNAFPKLVRDLAREHNKEADLIIRGEDIEIDRRVLDELKDPFIHLLRNCIDHGIESPDGRVKRGKPGHGSIAITAIPVQGNQVEFTVWDDGAGIDSGTIKKAALRLGLISAEETDSLTEDDVNELIFHSGLTTSPIITDLSGRGLGLAIVREKVEKLGGSITVSSAPGAGTTFRMLVPLSLATFRGVFVEVAGQRFVIPTSSVVRVSRVNADEIKTVENRQTIAVGGCAVSLVRLRDVLELSNPGRRSNGDSSPVVVVRAADRQVAFLVDEVVGEQELMVKSLGQQLARVRNVAGASITDSGAVIPILNALDLVESACTVGAPRLAEDVEETTQERRRRLLIAEDSITARTLIKTILEGAGYDVVTTVDGMDALTTLKTEPFDLVVSDVDMPRMNGFELTSRIRADKKLENMPIVLVTALGSQKDREYGIEVGANAYIVKSDFDQSNLLEIIRRFL